MLVAECFAFVWGVNTPMIVVDIDGTITRSDVSGLLMTLTPGLLTDRTHLGICKLLARMVDEAVRATKLATYVAVVFFYKFQRHTACLQYSVPGGTTTVASFTY